MRAISPKEAFAAAGRTMVELLNLVAMLSEDAQALQLGHRESWYLGVRKLGIQPCGNMVFWLGDGVSGAGD